MAKKAYRPKRRKSTSKKPKFSKKSISDFIILMREAGTEDE